VKSKNEKNTNIILIIAKKPQVKSRPVVYSSFLLFLFLKALMPEGTG